jgi:cystathionine gamma-synthase
MPIQSSTAAVRAGIAKDRHHGAVVPPLHLSANFAFERFNKPRTFDYTRSGNPTRSQLGDAIAELELGASAVITNTGMSAVTLVLNLLKPGDRIVAAHDCYGGTQRLLRGLASRGHFELTFADLTSSTGLDEIARVQPRIVWAETPSNPLLRITDIAAVTSVAHRFGAIVVVDNTFLSPALQQPILLGADLVVHSTTKYLNGHSDVVGGAVVAADAGLGEELKWWGNALGVTGAPFDSYLTLRGLRTLHVRIKQHDENAAAVVAALRDHPLVSKLYYPGLPSHIGHDIARRQQKGFGGMVSFEIAGGVAEVERFTSSLQHFTLAESLGGVESLIAHPATMTHASMTPEARTSAGITESLVRLSVGIEAAQDLIADLTRALDLAASARVAVAGSDIRARSDEGTSDVLILGAGAIGRELISQVLNTTAGASLRICGVVDTTGYVFDPDGIPSITLADIVAHKKSGRSLADFDVGTAATSSRSVDFLTLQALRNPILVDATAAETADHLELALGRGFDLVLANKVPLAGDQQKLDALLVAAAIHGRRILSEATVGAGLPVIDTIRKLTESGDEVLCIEGCPSGTLGFLLGEVGRDSTFGDALRSAVDLGYTEPDPRIDLSGLDVARKALILARLIGFRGDLSTVDVESLIPDTHRDISRDEFMARVTELDSDWQSRVSEARERGEILRYRARVTPKQISVGLVGVSAADPLAQLTGTDNQFSITTRRYTQPLVITGPGAGAPVTAAGVFSDLLRLVAERTAVVAG